MFNSKFFSVHNQQVVLGADTVQTKHGPFLHLRRAVRVTVRGLRLTLVYYINHLLDSLTSNVRLVAGDTIVYLTLSSNNKAATL